MDAANLFWQKGLALFYQSLQHIRANVGAFEAAGPAAITGEIRLGSGSKPAK
jgi:hypothetical protein